MSQTKIRRKVLVVPYVYEPKTDEIKLVMFKDADTAEWTLMSGGCKEKETYLACGHRELSEESNNSIKFSNIFDTFTFTTSYRPPQFLIDDQNKGIKILSKYTVFLFQITSSQFSTYKTKYYKSRNKETTDIKLFNIDSIAKTPNVWDFIRKTCIPKIKDHFQKKQFNDYQQSFIKQQPLIKSN